MASSSSSGSSRSTSPRKTSLIVEYLSGVAGGVAVVLVGHPFDTTKTLMQSAPQGMYKNTADCVRQVLRHEGVGGFYKGIWSPMYGQMVFRACSFTTYHYASVAIVNFNSRGDAAAAGRRASWKELMLAGAATGLCIAFIETPIDLVKTKLQTGIIRKRLNPSEQPLYSSVRECVSHVYRRHGWRGVYQGFPSTVIRNVPANALFFPVSEVLQRRFADQAGVLPSQIPLQQRLLAGACAGLCYWVGTYPLDAIKGQHMSADFDSRLSWLGTARAMYARSGVRAFFTGIAPCACRSVPACASMFATVDLTRALLADALLIP